MRLFTCEQRGLAVIKTKKYLKIFQQLKGVTDGNIKFFFRAGRVIPYSSERFNTICPSFVTHTVTHNKKWATA